MDERRQAALDLLGRLHARQAGLCVSRQMQQLAAGGPAQTVLLLAPEMKCVEDIEKALAAAEERGAEAARQAMLGGDAPEAPAPALREHLARRGHSLPGPAEYEAQSKAERAEVAPPRPSRRSSGRPNGQRRPDGQTRQRILEALGELEGAEWSAATLAGYCGVSSQAIRLQIAPLVATGKVRRLGSGSATRYVRA